MLPDPPGRRRTRAECRSAGGAGRRARWAAVLLVLVQQGATRAHDDGGSGAGGDTGQAIYVDVGAPASEVGRWRAPVDWPVLAIHAAVLPTGEVMHYAYPPERDGRPSVARLWDPDTDRFRSVSLDLEADVYCSGMAFLPDGRLYAPGGWAGEQTCTGAGIRSTHVFDPETSAWTRLEDLRRARYYPTSLELSDGSILILSGYDGNCHANRDIEVFHPDSGLELWPGVTRRMHLYPRAFQLNRRRVADVGPDPETYVLDLEERGWEQVDVTLLGLPRWEGAAFRVPGRRDTLMICGGYTDEHGTADPTETCERRHFGPQGHGQWEPAAPLHFRRAHANTVLLPDGTVLLVGGGQEGKYTTPVLNPELYDPETDTWTLLPREHYGRMYHSTAVLLPDGRVLSAGQDDDPGDGEQSGRTAEIYRPPYLYRGPRPKVLEAPAQVAYDSSFSVSTTQLDRIQRVVLLGLPTQTHSINPNQRYVSLDFHVAAGELVVDAPAGAKRNPPGSYMLFVLNDDGVPSKAQMVQLS